MQDNAIAMGTGIFGCGDANRTRWKQRCVLFGAGIQHQSRFVLSTLFLAQEHPQWRILSRFQTARLLHRFSVGILGALMPDWRLVRAIFSWNFAVPTQITSDSICFHSTWQRKLKKCGSVAQTGWFALGTALKLQNHISLPHHYPPNSTPVPKTFCVLRDATLSHLFPPSYT